MATLLAASVTEADETAFMGLIVNTERRGDAVVLLRPGDALIDAEALVAAEIRIPASARFERAGDRVFVSLDSLLPGLTWVLDEEAVALRLTATPALLGTTVFDLHNKPPASMERRQDT